MAQRHHLELTVDEESSGVVLRILSEGHEVFSTRLEAPELDELIRGLGDGRAQLTDEVSPQLDEGARITNVVKNPSYLVGTNSPEAKALIALRHPGFGWLGFQFRRPVVEAIVRELGRWLDDQKH
jgi:hypothetical protein